MEPLTQAGSAELQWVQPKAAQRTFELRAGSQVYGRLEFKSIWGSLASASARAGAWTFKRVGFFQPRVTIWKAGSEQELGVYSPNWSGTEGRIGLSNGNQYTWKVANFWMTQYTVRSAGGVEVVTFKHGVRDATFGDLFKVQAQVVLQPEGIEEAELAVLTLLGWYLMILQQDDSASTAAVTAAAV